MCHGDYLGVCLASVYMYVHVSISWCNFMYVLYTLYSKGQLNLCLNNTYIVLYVCIVLFWHLTLPVSVIREIKAEKKEEILPEKNVSF